MAGFAAGPQVDVAAAAEQLDALRAWSRVLAYCQTGWVEPQADLADWPLDGLVAPLADEPELPPAYCFLAGCLAVPLEDGSARAGCCSAEPQADALAPQWADSLPAVDYSAAPLVDDCWAALPGAGSLPLLDGLADCSVVADGWIPPLADDWPEPLRRPGDSAPADFPDDSPAGWRERQGQVVQAALRPRSPEDVPRLVLPACPGVRPLPPDAPLLRADAS